ncbi:MAG: hypothetical protein KAJ66_06590 [Candidatus Omnitrophica bacterium]|nr:hypothetical protein [Candidatus Omnitrophota bacterium]
MNIFEMIFNYFWAAAIVFTCINVLIYKYHSKKHIQQNPKLTEGYKKLFRGYLFWMNIPWIVMGIGCTVGNVPSIWYYFRPKNGNPYVLAWFGSIIVLWIIGTYWLFLKNGAEIIAKYPGVLIMYFGFKRTEITNPNLIKMFWLLCLTGGIFGLVFMWTMDVPIPDFC